MATAKAKTQTFLARLPLFQEATPEDLDRIAVGTTEHRVAKGQLLFQRGDPCVGFHVVVYGQVKLAMVSPNGSEKVIDLIGPGHSFGEALMFTDRAYVVFAQALSDSLLLHISKAAIDAEIVRDPRLARRMIAGLSMRLHGLIQDVEAYSLRSGMQRVIGYLLRDIEEQSAGTPVRVVLDANKGVIASRLNLTPEHFSRILSDLTHQSLIEVHGSEIRILDTDRLRSSLN
jgi:CRP-like cAMP-binding protein